ncbi:upf0481 protein [Quercus suber]|uniref:Upf0481 protein n=1 Tax=Quercus suber TaxID=58331 RepID=A0AAW0JZL5_QUESU
MRPPLTLYQIMVAFIALMFSDEVSCEDGLNRNLGFGSRDGHIIDVGHLHYHGIIEHWLGNDVEVVDLFNCLCQEVVFDINDSYLSHFSEDVNRYYDHKWNAWCASLRHNYFCNPWAIISLVVVVFLLLITFT